MFRTPEIRTPETRHRTTRSTLCALLSTATTAAVLAAGGLAGQGLLAPHSLDSAHADSASFTDANHANYSLTVTGAPDPMPSTGGQVTWLIDVENKSADAPLSLHLVDIVTTSCDAGSLKWYDATQADSLRTAAPTTDAASHKLTATCKQTVPATTSTKDVTLTNSVKLTKATGLDGKPAPEGSVSGTVVQTATTTPTLTSQGSADTPASVTPSASSSSTSSPIPSSPSASASAESSSASATPSADATPSASVSPSATTSAAPRLRLAAITAARAGSGGKVTSANGRIALLKTANRYDIPAGGASVTYSYTVTNSSIFSGTVVSAADDKCSPLTGPSTVPANGSATFTCTQKITASTTNTATFAIKTGLTTDTVSATATVVMQPTPTYNCSTIGFTTFPGSTGAYGSMQPGQLPSGSTPLPDPPAGPETLGFSNSAASAISPLEPQYLYYSAQRSAPSTGSAGIVKLDRATGASTLVIGPSAATATNRLAFDATGTLWSMATDGVLYSLAPGATSWTAHALASPVPGAYGDIVFDGLGNMWVLVSDNKIGKLYVISQDQLAKTSGVTAQFIGNLTDTSTTGWFGLAFGPDGTLYGARDHQFDANTDTTQGSVWTIDLNTGKATEIGRNSALGYVQDLASCAMPKPNLAITKTVDKAQTQAGDTLTYTITIKNTGTLAAAGVKFSDQTPPNTTYVSSTLNGAPVGSSGVNYWATPQLVRSPGAAYDGVIAAGSEARITMTVKVDSTIPNTVKAICNQGSTQYVGITVPVKSDDPTKPNIDDATCTALPEPPAPKIDLTKAATGDFVDATNHTSNISAPKDVTYTYTLTNPGNETLENVKLTDDKCTAITGPLAKDTTKNPATGDINADGKLQVGETWLYTCTQNIASKTTNTAVVNATGETSKTPVTDTDKWTVTVPASGAAQLTKVDAKSGKALSGAVFSLYQTTATSWTNGKPTPDATICAAGTAKGKTPIASGVTTDAAGKTTFTGLQLADIDYTTGNVRSSGTYTVYCAVETKAPAGYNLASAPFTVVVLSTDTAINNVPTALIGIKTNINGTSQVVVANTTRNLTNQLPNTGGNGVDPLASSGLALLLAAGIASRRKMHH